MTAPATSPNLYIGICSAARDHSHGTDGTLHYVHIGEGDANGRAEERRGTSGEGAWRPPTYRHVRPVHWYSTTLRGNLYV